MGKLMQVHSERYADTPEHAWALMPTILVDVKEYIAKNGHRVVGRLPLPTPSLADGLSVKYIEDFREIVFYRLVPAPGDVFVARVDVLVEG